MRQRTKEYYKKYYNYLQEQRNNKELSFSEIINYFYQTLGRVETSFSSKLLSIINTDMPVWDKYVLENLNLHPIKSWKSSEYRIKQSIETYEVLCKWYDKFLLTDISKEIVLLFDQSYPNNKITDVKKIDLILWQMR